MLTVIFTEKDIHVFGQKDQAEPIVLVKAELAGRRHPMTSTFHVFLNTIINRYKDQFLHVQYPIPINIVFPTSAYFSKAARVDLLKYILDRNEVISLKTRKSLMEAVVQGWNSKNTFREKAWVAIEGGEEIIVGVKEGDNWPLKIKLDETVGSDALLKELQEYVSKVLTVQEATLLQSVDRLSHEQVNQILQSKKLELKFTENQGLPDTTLEISENIVAEILKRLSNKIFLHINNLYVKLPNGNPVLFIGSFLNQPAFQKVLSAEGLRYDYPTTFIGEEQSVRLAVHSFNKTTEQQTHLSQTAKNTSTIDSEVNLASSPQSQITTQSNNSKIPDGSTESSSEALISKEFVIEKRFKDQAFLFFRGYRKDSGIRKFFRFTTYEDCNSADRRGDFIKLYKKEKKLYPSISSVVNGITGKYYYIPDIKAKPLREIVASMKIRSSIAFKSEDIQLLRNIYQAIEALPVTFSNLSVDNIYVDQGSWWRTTQQNEIYFLGLSVDDCPKSEMFERLNEVLKSSIHPTIIDHIHN